MNRTRAGKDRRGDAAFTLLEVTISSVVLVILVTSIYQVMSSSSRTYEGGVRLATMQDQARKVIDDLAEELRTARQSTVVLTTFNGSSQIQFTKAIDFSAGTLVWSPTPILWNYQPSPVDANNNGVQDEGRIVRTGPGATTVVVGTDNRTVENGPPTTRTKCHYVKSGGFTVTRTGNNLVIRLTLIGRDGANKVLETFVETAVTMRNGT